MEPFAESTWCRRLWTRGPLALLGLIVVLSISWGVLAPRAEAVAVASAGELNSDYVQSGRPSKDDEPMVPAEDRDGVPKDSPALTPEYEAKAMEAAQSAALIARAFVERHSVATLFEILPPSYLADIAGAVRLFAVQMDQEVWAKVIPIADRLIALAVRHKVEVAKPLAVLFGASQEELAKAQADAEGLIDMVADGWQRLKDDGLTNLATLRNFSLAMNLPTLVWMEARFYRWVDSLSSGAMTSNFRESFSRMERITYSPTSCNSPNPPEVVCLEGVAGDIAEEVEMELVDGRWIPITKADWDRDIKSIREDFEAMGKQFREEKATILKDIAEFSKKLARAEKAATLLEAATILEIPLPFPLDGGQPVE